MEKDRSRAKSGELIGVISELAIHNFGMFGVYSFRDNSRGEASLDLSYGANDTGFSATITKL